MKVKNADVLSTLVVIIYIHIGVIVTQEDPQSASFLNYSFKDDMCDWESISAGWKIGQGSPITSGTGSAQDHSLRNARRIYIYLDPKSVNTSQSQVLQNPLLPCSCLLLWYRICGNDTGKRTVSIETKDATTTTKFSTTQSGNRTIYWSHEGKLDDKWHSVEITKQTDEAFRTLFVGKTKIQNGAIAVDENELSKRYCKDDCGFDVGFCNWIQRTSDGFRWIRTGTDGASFPKTTGSQSGCSNNTTGPQSHRNTMQTTPQSGHTNKTTDPQSHRNTMQTTSQSGSTNITTGLQSHRHTNQTTPQSGHTNKTTDPQSHRNTMQTTPQSGSTSNTTGPQSHRNTMQTTPRSGSTNKTTGLQSHRNTMQTTSQSGSTNKTTGPQSSRTNQTTGPQKRHPNKTGTNVTSTTRDLKESTFSVDWENTYTNTTRPPQSNVTEASTNGSGYQITTQGHIPQVTVEVITVSLVGAVMFVVLSVLVGVWICRTRRRHRKKIEPFELQPIASKPSSIDDERGYSSSAANCINPGYTHSSNASLPGNKALNNGKTDEANYKYASAFQSTTPAQWTYDTYDITGDQTKPHFEGAYDHIPTHFAEEYDATHLTIRTRLDACETYDHVTICPDDVYDEACVAQASTIQYKSYDQVTKGTCKTPVSKQNIINSQDNIYEFVA